MAYSYDRRADLSPPLGHPGGPCHVVDRIEKTVRSPARREQLEGEIEQGQPLSNAESATVYRVQDERGAGLWRTLNITPHAQYRMDLRGITVPAVRAALASFSKVLLDWKSMGHPRYQDSVLRLQTGTLEWVDPRLSLALVLSVRNHAVWLVTTYWKGERDPQPPSPGECGL